MYSEWWRLLFALDDPFLENTVFVQIPKGYQRQDVPYHDDIKSHSHQSNQILTILRCTHYIFLTGKIYMDTAPATSEPPACIPTSSISSLTIFFSLLTFVLEAEEGAAPCPFLLRIILYNF